jgi:hypothetical protein
MILSILNQLAGIVGQDIKTGTVPTRPGCLVNVVIRKHELLVRGMSRNYYILEYLIIINFFDNTIM